MAPRTLECNQCSVAFHSKLKYAAHLKKHRKMEFIEGNNELLEENKDEKSKTSTSEHTDGMDVQATDKNVANEAEVDEVSSQQIKSEISDLPDLIKNKGAEKLVEHIRGRLLGKIQLLLGAQNKTLSGTDISPPADVTPIEKIGQRVHQCSVCKKKFKWRDHLNQHTMMTSCSGQLNPIHNCDVCGKIYARKDKLEYHLRIHTGEVIEQKEGKHKCNLCFKSFRDPSSLKIHTRIHTGEKPFSCDFCERRFPSASALNLHRRVHTGEKPYNCDECGQKFALRQTLNRHMSLHIRGTTRRNISKTDFRCTTCKKYFSMEKYLKKHIRYVHEKVVTFPCIDCEKVFAYKKDLTHHRNRNHTKEEQCSSKECGVDFPRKDSLQRHMTIRHCVGSEELV